MTYKGIGECRAITLTGGADTFSPNSGDVAFKTTSGDDLFRAVDAVGGSSELDTLDYIDGGAGNDTLTVSQFATAATPVLANIENVNVTHTGAVTLTLTDASGITNLKSVGATANAAFANITLGTNLIAENTGAITTTFGFKAAQVTGDADAVALTVAGHTSTGAVTINSIETVNVTTNAKTGTAASNNLGLTGDSIETVTVAGSKAMVLDLTGAGIAATLETVDASAATAALTVDLAAALTQDVSVTLGSGADTIDFTGAGVAVVLNTGAGNDTVTIDVDDITSINLGAGADTLNVDATAGATAGEAILAAGDITTSAKLAAAAVKVEGFVSGSDVLNLTTTVGLATAEIALTGTDLATIAGSENLLAATQAAAAFAAAAGDVVVFQHGSDTYALVNESGADSTLGAGDILIQLVGVTSTVAADVVTA